MDKVLMQKLMTELKARKTKIDWRSKCFPAQWDFITHPARKKAVQCTRRAGKSFSAGIYLLKEALENRNVKCVYIAKTRQVAKNIILKDVLQVIIREYGVPHTFNQQALEFTFTNGSSISLVGADQNASEMDKLLGQKFKLVVIDEAAFFKQSLEDLVYEVLVPATIDYKGTVAMISTTSDLTNSLYYDVTNYKEPGWEVFKWTTKDNPHMMEKFNEEVEEQMAVNPRVQETPNFRRMYLNEWVVDHDSRVYKFTEENIIESLPEIKDNPRLGYEWKYVLGVDFGWNDDTAFSVIAYHPGDEPGRTYIIDTYSSPNMISDDVVVRLKHFQAKYPGLRIVVDPASKQFIEDIKRRFGFSFISAEKSSKKEYIELLNNDFIMRKLSLLPDTTQLQGEYNGLIWDGVKQKAGKYVEHPACPNHIADATLYAWRYCYAYVNKPEIRQPSMYSKDPNEVEEAIILQAEREAERISLIESNQYDPELDYEGYGEMDYSD